MIGRTIPVGISARHVHLCQHSIDRLFGEGYQLTFSSALSQPGQYAARETVTLAGPRGRLPAVRVLGPPRGADQVELSRSDEMTLGIDAPLRVSGDLDATPGIAIAGPAGQIVLEHGVITATRHIHMSPQDALDFGVRDRQRVVVAIDSEGRDLLFDDVVVRVSPDFRLELHLDTDEGNAAGVASSGCATIARIAAPETAGRPGERELLDDQFSQ